MYKRALVVMMIAAAVLLAACGGPAPTATAAPTQPPVATATEAAATEAATEAATVASVTPQQAASTRVVVLLKDNTLQTSQTTFQAGVPYTLVVTNSGRREHNFNINPPVAVAGSISAALDAALLTIQDDRLAPGQTATVEFTFPASAVGTQLEFSCLIRRHYDDGMFQTITVTS